MATYEQPLSPYRVLEMNYGFSHTALLVAAVRLRLFSHLDATPRTAQALAALVGTEVDPTARLLRGLEGLGLVTHADLVYQLTPLAGHFLVEGKPTYLGGDTLAMLDYLPAWLGLDQTARTSVPYRDLGDAATAEAFFAPRVRDLFPLVHPVAQRTFAALDREDIRAAERHLLDVGAGSAPWSIAFAELYAGARITAIDLPAVAEAGRGLVAERGLNERFIWMAGNIEEVPLTSQEYDIIVVGHLLRFFSDARSQALLQKLSLALHPGGMLLIADVFLADNGQGPPAAITLDLSMLVNSAGGRIRTCQEVAHWMKGCGLSAVERLQGAGPFPILVAFMEGRPEDRASVRFAERVR